MWWRREEKGEWRILQSQEHTLSLDSQSIHLGQSSSTASPLTQMLSASNPKQAKVVLSKTIIHNHLHHHYKNVFSNLGNKKKKNTSCWKGINRKAISLSTWLILYHICKYIHTCADVHAHPTWWWPNVLYTECDYYPLQPKNLFI